MTDEGRDPGAEQPATGLGAPDAVLISVRSLFGPLAALLGGRQVAVAPTIVPLVGDTAGAVTIAAVGLDPLRDADTGVEAVGRLHGRADPARIEEHSAGRVVLGGRGPAAPGRYASALRIRLIGREAPLVVPVMLSVAASPLWGVGCMVLGLIALGVVNVLAAESALRDKQRDVLQAAQAFHERIEQTPLPERNEQEAADIDREYAAALRLLTAPRSLGVVDHRATDAEPHLAAAERMQADLARATGGSRAGDAEIDDLLAEWKIYRDLAGDLERLAPASGLPRPPADAGLGALADAYRLRFAQRFVRLPVDYNTAQLNDLILETRLAAAAGRTEEARARALDTRRWLRRASDDLARGLALVKGEKLLGFDMVSNAMQVGQHLDHDGLPPDRVAKIRMLLDEAAAGLAGPEPPATGHDDDLAMAAANRLVNHAQVELARARRDVRKGAVDAAIAATEAETTVDDVAAALAREQDVHPTTPEAKMAGLRRVLAVWRGKAGSVADEAVRASILAQIDAVTSAADTGDLKGMSAPYRTLTEAWTAWSVRRVNEAVTAVLMPYCEEDKNGDLVRIAQITESLRQQPPRPELAQWEQSLDRIRAETLRVDPGDRAASPDCDTALRGLEQRTVELSNEIFRRETLDRPIPVSEQRAALGMLRMDTSVLDRPRRLTLRVQGLESDQEVGTRIRFALAGGDPSWSTGVTVAVDFGDGSVPLRIPAEALARGTPVEHEYAAPLLARLRVAAAEQDDPFATNAVLLGAGDGTLAVRPSEITALEALSDVLLNARFVLALLIGGTIYYWRFHAGKKVFGAQGFDYAEAFALGFVVNAVVADLPGQIARIATIG